MALQHDKVILVNEQDEWMNTAGKEEAHRLGALHRALSIFITNSAGETLLQRRADDKYHSGGLWSNACCSHPSPGESTLAAAHRRLYEELGFDTLLEHIGALTYRAELTNGLIEHEYDHLFVGVWDGAIVPAPEEINEIRWMHPEAIYAWLSEAPEAFSAWFPLVLRKWQQRNIAGIHQLL